MVMFKSKSGVRHRIAVVATLVAAGGLPVAVPESIASLRSASGPR
jgi:hypothetical protein